MRKNSKLTAAEIQDARDAKLILMAAGWDSATPFSDAARLAVGAAVSVSPTAVQAAIDLFIRDCIRRNLSDRTVGDYMSKLDAFADGGRGERFLDDFARRDLRDWLLALPVGDETRAGYLRVLKTFWSFALEHEPALCRLDPTRRLALSVKKEVRDVATFSPGQLAEVMRCAELGFGRHPGLTAGAYAAGAALNLFAGLRPSEISSASKPSLLWGAINFEERIIRLPAAVVKGQRVARILEDLSPTLWCWLERYRGAPEAPVCRYQMKNFPDHVKRYSELIDDWPQDVLRHSFVTYDVVLHGSVERTSEIIGHEGKPKLLRQRYKGLRTKAEAAMVVQILPQAG